MLFERGHRLLGAQCPAELSVPSPIVNGIAMAPESQQPESEVPGFADRMDPDGRTRQAISDSASLLHPAARAVFESLGVPREAFEQMLSSHAALKRLITAYDRWLPLTQLGWVLTDLAKPDVYDQATRVLAEGRTEEAESLIEEHWNQPGNLELAISRIRRTAIYTDARMRVGKARIGLFQEAVACHRDGRYSAALGIVIPQMEGMVLEVGLPSPYQQPSRLVDDTTAGGHPQVLKVIYEFSRRSVKKTTLDDSRFPLRHGIEHGRLLGYGNRRNSTKAFVAAAELANFCQARLKEAYEAGVLEELDRRVFAEPLL